MIYTPHETKSMKAILAIIRANNVLTRDEEYELWQKMRNGSTAARNRLINSNLGFVLSTAKQYLWSGMPLEDLFQAGAIGLTIATDNFDATRGYKLITYASWYVKHEIQKAVNAHVRGGVTVGLETPLPFSKGEEITWLDKLCLEQKYNADWDARYTSAYEAVKSKVKEELFEGAADFLDDYCSMSAKGYQLYDVAKKHNVQLWRAKNLIEEIEKRARVVYE